jgi:colicin import membrane protein
VPRLPKEHPAHRVGSPLGRDPDRWESPTHEDAAEFDDSARTTGVRGQTIQTHERPRQRGLRAFGLALAVHLALFAMLFVGIRWQTQRPVAVQAELWRPAPTQPPEPQPAPEPKPAPEPVPAPPPPPPPEPPKPVAEPPPAPKPDIALEREKERKRIEKEREEQERLRQQEAARKAEEEKRLAEEKRKAEEKRLAEEKRKTEEKRLAEEKRKAEEKRLAEEKRKAEEKRLAEEKRKAEEKRLAEQSRKEYMRQLMTQAGAGSATDNSARAGAASGATSGGASGGREGDYVAKISSLLISNTTYQVPADLAGNPKAVFVVSLMPDCSIAAVRLKRSSGVPAWDQAAERGIQRSDPFPRRPDGSCPRELEISRGPRDDR